MHDPLAWAPQLGLQHDARAVHWVPALLQGFQAVAFPKNFTNTALVEEYNNVGGEQPGDAVWCVGGQAKLLAAQPRWEVGAPTRQLGICTAALGSGAVLPAQPFTQLVHPLGRRSWWS